MAAIKSRVRVDVPQDLVNEILTRLPVKSLLRLRCVCKFWCDLIANPDFITEHHLKQTTINKNLGNFFLKYTEKVTGLPMISIVKDYNVTETICVPFTHVFCTPYILGPCNGLLCISYYEDGECGIWNPATRELKIIPEIHVDYLPDFHRKTYRQIGFGFDHKTNDYKIVRFVDHSFNGWRDDVREVNIYSLRSESWRQIPPMEGGKLFPYDNQNAYHDGVHYWRCYGHTFEDHCLLSFDMADEVFKRLPLIPNWRDIWDESTFKVGIYNGSLSLIVEFNGKIADLWMMTETNGGKVSWVKQISIGSLIFIYRSWFLNNGGCLCMNMGWLALCDPKTQQLNKLFRVDGDSYQLQVISYEESLVSFKGERISQEYRA